MAEGETKTGEEEEMEEEMEEKMEEWVPRTKGRAMTRTAMEKKTTVKGID